MRRCGLGLCGEVFDQGSEFDLQGFGLAGLAFPDFEDLPAGGAELAAVAFVAFDVGAALFGPEGFVGCGGWFAVFAAVHVPEAAVDEEDGSGAGKDEVGLAGEVFDVESVAEAERVE